MPDREDFVDFYAVLQVDPQCDLKMIENAYRHLAKIYHPDHEKTADRDRVGTSTARKDDPLVSADMALGDAALQRNILLYLYKARRENFRGNGIGSYMLQDHFGCTDDNFEFHVWYLRSKGYVEVTESGTLAITVDGVDHVIALHQPREPDRLLTDKTQRSV